MKRKEYIKTVYADHESIYLFLFWIMFVPLMDWLLGSPFQIKNLYMVVFVAFIAHNALNYYLIVTKNVYITNHIKKLAKKYGPLFEHNGVDI